KRSLYKAIGETEKLHMNKRQVWASIATLVFFGIVVYGVMNKGWFMVEMAGLFIIMGIVVGLFAGLKTTEICEGVNEGFRDVLMGALIVGMTRAVAVVPDSGELMDTIHH